MNENPNPGFQERMFQESEHVYDRICQGLVTDVEAELMDAKLRASVQPDQGQAGGAA